MNERKFAKVPIEFQRNGIKVVVLEYDSEDTKGYFLYLHETLEEEATFDEWYETIDIAVKAAKIHWGIAPKDWISENMTS